LTKWQIEDQTPKPLDVTPKKDDQSKVILTKDEVDEKELIGEPKTPVGNKISREDFHQDEEDGKPVNGAIQPIPVMVNNVDTSTPTSIPIPVLHLETSPVSSRSSSTEELWTPRSLLLETQERNEKMLSSLSFSHDLLHQLRQERGELEKDLRVFSESIPLMMSDECVNSLRQRMAKRIAKIETSFNSFSEGRSKTRRDMISVVEDGKQLFLLTVPLLVVFFSRKSIDALCFVSGQLDLLQKRFQQSKARFRNLLDFSSGNEVE